MPIFTLTVNRRKRQVEADPEMPLLWVLRDLLQLTGTKYGCGIVLGFVLAAAPAALGEPGSDRSSPDQSAPDMSWYVTSLCPDDGIACTTEDVVYGQCRHLPDPGACPDDGVFCDGKESCGPDQGGCASSGSPCGGETPICDEVSALCLPSGVDESDRRSGPGAARRSAGPPVAHALRFDGVDDVVTAAAQAATSITTAFTLEAWVRPGDDPQAGRGVIAGQDGEFLLARGPDGTLEWAVHAASHPFRFVEVATAGLPRNAWSHVALTYDGAHVRAYLNGARVATQAATGALRHASAPAGLFRIGGGGGDAGLGDGCFAGVITDVRLWRVARSGESITADRRRRLRGTEPGLVGYWRLDEGRGDVVTDAARGNAGVLANGVIWVDGRTLRPSVWI